MAWIGKKSLLSVALLLVQLASFVQGQGGPWRTISYDNFSKGWGNYASIFGTGNAQWVASSLRIQDNAGANSAAFLLSYYDVTSYSDLRVRFWYYADSMTAFQDSFYLEYQDDIAGDWQIVKHFVAGRDFVNHQHKYAVVTFSREGTFSMTHTAKIRFRCEATDRTDRVYLDEIRFEGLRSNIGFVTRPPAQVPAPSQVQSLRPSLVPSLHPSTSMAPPVEPSGLPSTSPTPPSSLAPSQVPSTSSGPSARPSLAPSLSPSLSLEPSQNPSTSVEPSTEPSAVPSLSPSQLPSLTPSQFPSTSSKPSARPSLAPSLRPSVSSAPTLNPSISVAPSAQPSRAVPSEAPSTVPSENPTTFVEGICPKGRRYPPEKFAITPFTDNDSNDSVEDDLYEISYVAYSAQTDSAGHVYAYMASDKEQYSLKVIQLTHNIFDSKNHFNGHGTTVATYTLFTEEPVNEDWEDISLGPCTDTNDNTVGYTTDQVCIYIGSIGNNRDPQRREVSVYKFAEPSIDWINGPQDLNVSFATIGYEYGTGFDASTLYDAEAMFVDWVGVSGNNDENQGDLYVATKGFCEGGVGKIPVSAHRDLGPGQVLSGYSMPRVVDLPRQGDVPCSEGGYRRWTGADMAKHGQLLAMVRGGYPGPASVYFYPRTADQSVAEALFLSSCDYVASIAIGLDHEKQYEAVGFVDPEALRFGTISECGSDGECSPTLYQFELEYPDSSFLVLEGPKEGWTQLSYDTFDPSGEWGNWQSGGDHADISNLEDSEGSNTCDGKCACEGDWALELYQDRGVPSSAFHHTSYDCETFSLLRVTFQFKFRGYDHLDTLFLEISMDGGSTHFIVGDWAHSVPELPDYPDPLTRAICYVGKVTLRPADFRLTSFGDSVKLRFRNSGNSNNDSVYIDKILFEGHVGESMVG